MCEFKRTAVQSSSHVSFNARQGKSLLNLEVPAA